MEVGTEKPSNNSGVRVAPSRLEFVSWNRAHLTARLRSKSTQRLL